MEAAVSATPTGLCIRGRVDFLNAEQLCAEGSRLLKAHAEPISVDLEKLDHAGSVVIAILMEWARESPQALRLVALPKAMRRVLEFTGMDELFVLPDPSVADGSGAILLGSDASIAAVGGSGSADQLVNGTALSVEADGKESNV